MSHEEDAIREIIAELDHVMNRVRTLAERADIGREADNALDDLKVARHRLRDIGHGGHFDTPKKEE